jgi:heterodisulfide reductase subunit A
MSVTEGSALVIGGGIAGIQASIDIGNMGFKVYLVERTPSIGGRMAQLDKTFPTNDCSICILAPKMNECFEHENVNVLTYSEVQSVEKVGKNFKVKIRKKPRYVDIEKCTGCGDCIQKCPVKIPNEFNMGLDKRRAIYLPFLQAVPGKMTIDEKKCIYILKNKCGNCKKVCKAGAIDFDQKEEILSIEVGAIVVATGLDPYDVSKLRAYNYNKIKNVITALEFERILSASGPTSGHIERPSDGKVPKNIAFIQCVCSRDENFVKHCSSVCCMHATKEAILANEHHRDIKSYVFYMDLRAVGKGFRKFVQRAENDYNVKYIRARPASIFENQENGNPIIEYEDTDDGEIKSKEVDLVVLSHALIPSKGNVELARILGINLDEHGFFKVPNILTKPMDTEVEGIFVCGYCQSPQDIPDSVTQAGGVAARAAELMEVK